MSNAATPFFKDGRQFPTQAQLDSAVSELAELLSTDRYTFAQIATEMGVSCGSVCALFRLLCVKMGESVPC